MNTETTHITQERLIGDLRLVIENAEQLLKNTNQYTSDIYQNEELARVEEAQLARMIDATHAANIAFSDQSGEARLLRAFRPA
jgi:hypothetical protein